MLKDVKETASWKKSKGGFSVIEVPAIIVSIETFVHLQKDAEKILGLDGAAVLFYEAGKNATKRWYNQFFKEWGLKDKKFIEAVQNHYAELGFGIFSIEEDNENEVVVRAENSFIANVVSLTEFFNLFAGKGDVYFGHYCTSALMHIE